MYISRWKIDCHTKFVHWDCQWDVDEDSSLLKGIYEYGMGNWESIKMDSELHLYDKVSVAGWLTVRIWKIWTPEKIGVITQKFKQCCFTVELCIQKVQTEWQTV